MDASPGNTSHLDPDCVCPGTTDDPACPIHGFAADLAEVGQVNRDTGRLAGLRIAVEAVNDELRAAERARNNTATLAALRLLRERLLTLAADTDA